MATDAVVVSGLEGEESFALSQDYMPGGSMLRAVGDMVGSSAPDLLWTTTSDTRTPAACASGLVTYACAQYAESEFEAQLIEGGSFEISWAKSFSGAHVRLWPAGGDLHGDGRPDLQGESYWTTGTCAYALLVSTCEGELLDLFISGQSGEDLWERKAYWNESYPVVIGDVGGTPGTDVVYFKGEWESDSISVVATRLDGATGLPVLVTRSSYPDSPAGWTSVSAFLSPDTDGDGVLDLVFASAYYDYEQRAITRSMALVESGRTGDDLYDTSFEGHETYVRGGDLDGDGLADLIGVQREISLDRLHVSLRAVHPGPGTLSWRRTGSVAFEPGSEWFWISIRPAGNLSRVDGGDLISSIHMQHFDDDTETWGIRWQVEAVAGSNGSNLWSHGSL